MLELGGGATLFRLVAWIILAAIALALILALLRPRGWRKKTLAAGGIVLVLGAPLAPDWFRSYQLDQRRELARAIFQERCKSAGVKIYKTVENVDGVLLLKRRPDNRASSADQYALNDPYGIDLPGEGYAHTMLWGRNSDGGIVGGGRSSFGYRFAVLVNEDGSSYTKYEVAAVPKKPGELMQVAAAPATSLPRYGITYEDISTREDRANWVAGSRLVVLDTQTREVLAERIGWMFDPGLGSTEGETEPWMRATRHACPPFATFNSGVTDRTGQTREFAERVLKPSKGTHE